MRDYIFQWPRLGHDTAERILQKSIAQQSLAHAYLIYGPEGIGKKELVFNFVGSLICTDENRKPCRACDMCLQVEHDLYPDLHTIGPDADSRSISVEQIRSLKRLINFRSVSALPKIVVLERAESMTQVAANALLKLLEEPPQGVTIILIADSLRTIPSTVLSRCQLIHCKPASDSVVRKILDELSDDEIIKAEIAANASGRIRFAKEMLVDGGERFKKDSDFSLMLLESSALHSFLLTSELAHNEVHELPDETQENNSKQGDNRILTAIESLLRDIIVIKADAGSIAHTSQYDRLAALASKISFADLYRMLTGISDLRQRLATYAHAQLAWEHYFINTHSYV